MDIAVVGLAGRFPGARDVGELWRNLCGGVESITAVSDEELRSNGVEPELINNPHYVKVDAPLSDYDCFDARFFGYGAREATIMDPQQRVFLECCWEALEDAGYDCERLDKLVGVYAGAGASGYFFHYLYPQRGKAGSVDPFEIGAGNSVSSLAARVSYKLNLRGPSLAVQTACSSSLVAVHLAAQSLLNEECDLALAGGVFVRMPVKGGYLYKVDGLLSPDGHCRPFDAEARGTVFGSGAGVVVLKRLQEALEDGDLIHAVIKGSAVNNDGAAKAGFTAPNSTAQAEVVTEALAVADISPATVTYIEAHGTGTALGDPIEVRALTKAFGPAVAVRKTCALGSVKANIGHLDAAAGVAGLIKTVLALRHRKLPPSLNFCVPNPEIDFSSSPFYVNTELREWTRNGVPRRAGVSSFGLGGTNCHVVLEEPPEQTREGVLRQWHLLPLSAKTDSALDSTARRLADFLSREREIELSDVAYTYQIGRKQWSNRRVIIAGSTDEAVRILRAPVDNGSPSDTASSTKPSTAFLFTAQPSQTVTILKALYSDEPSFKRHVDDLADVLAARWGRDIRPYFLAEEASEADCSAEDPNLRMFRGITSFIVQYSVAKTLMDWGVTPQAVMGEGAAEYPAACIAGILSLADALELFIGGVFRESPGSQVSTAWERIEYRPPRIPFSARTGQWITAQEAVSADYWRGPIDGGAELESQLRLLSAAGSNLLVRVAELSAIGLNELSISSAVPESTPDECGRRLHEVVGRLWISGVPIAWNQYSAGIPCRKASVPTYPFEPQRYWPESAVATDTSMAQRPFDVPASAALTVVESPEECLTRLFMELLGLRQISPSARFTDLGGDSLLATQLASRIRDLFAVTLSLRSILEEPTVEKLAALVKAAQVTAEPAPQGPQPRKDRHSPTPLSFGQQRQWFLDSLSPADPSFNITHGIRIQGEVDFDVLERSINEVVQRHEVLRTAFLYEQGELVQVVQPSLDLKLTLVDLRDEATAEQDEFLRTLALQAAREGFDLRRPPLLRATLFKLSEVECVLLFTMHHIVCDGWSFGVLVKEVTTLYESIRRGNPCALRELPIQYADYAVWQRNLLQGEKLESLLSYWRGCLGGLLSPLALPTDRPRPPTRSSKGGRQAINVPAATMDEIHALCSRHDVTLFMTLLTAFAVLLKRYTSQDDLLIGTPVANRTDSTLESLIGFFVNFLVLRVDSSGNPTFSDLLLRVRETTLEAFSHQELPFEKLVEDLQPTRDASRTPLFEVLFVLQNTPTHPFEIAGVTVRSCDIDPGTATYDLTLSLEETSAGLAGWIEYNSDLFDPATIARMADHWRQLLQSISSAPERRIDELDLLPQAEAEQLLGAWCGRAERRLTQPVPQVERVLQPGFEWESSVMTRTREALLHELFAAQAERTPDAVAVVHGEHSLTYSELNARSNQLAHYLRSAGVGAETLVALLVDRGIEMTVALLGVLKAGGAYVPLDPQYPSERLSFMLEDTAAPVLLTQSGLVGKLTPHDARVLCLDLEAELIARESRVTPISLTCSQNLAYVIYTSGSTGRPKGVMISHESVVNFLSSFSAKLELSSQDVWLSVTTLSFDPSALEIFGPLLLGGRVAIESRETAADAKRLMRSLKNSGATLLQATPTTWRLLVEGGWRGDSHLKALCGGEEMSPQLAATLLERTGMLWNIYGPTETTVWSAAHHVESAEGPVPIGRPIANMLFYNLDAKLRPVPVGIRGELHVGGAGVGRGYWKRPALTAEKFTPDPLTEEPGARFYRTGDLTRFLASGALTYLGRADDQVKVRGFRIEIGEIEAVMREHESVREAVVMASDQAGETRLLGYVTGRARQQLDVRQLRGHLSWRLPAYMIPSHLIEIERMPLTPSGKINRRALPEIESVRPARRATRPAPASPLHRQITAIVEEVLQLDGVEPDDNFFEFGAHSFLMVKLKERLDTALGRDIQLLELFRHPTVNALTRLLDEVAKPDVAVASSNARARVRKELRQRRQHTFQ